MRRLRTRLAALGAIAATLALAGALIAAPGAGAAKPTKVKLGNLELRLNGGVAPKRLPKRRYAPIALKVSGGIRTLDGNHPPALRKVVLDTDRNGKVNARGLPVCHARELQSRDTRAAKRACPKAIVGSGRTDVSVALAESRPVIAHSRLLAFNGGTHHGVTTIYIHAYITIPIPAAIVTTVKVRKHRHGRTGLRSVARIPKIASGNGSVTSFKLRFHRLFRFHHRKRSYLTARCHGGKFLARARAFFAGGEKLAGTVVRPCRAKGH